MNAVWYGDNSTYSLPTCRARSADNALKRVAREIGVPISSLRYEGVKTCDLVGAADGGYSDDPAPCYVFRLINSVDKDGK